MVLTQVGSPEDPASWVELDDTGRLVPRSAAPSARAGLLPRIRTAFAAAFLPVGYPISVTPDYLSFQLWDSIQALSSYVRGMLSTQAMLAAVGVGDAAATPAAALTLFVFKDATGLLASILFAATKGSAFDAHAKQWRLAADVANDLGLAAELAAPAVPARLFLPLACAGAVCRAVTGVAGGATRVALTQHFAAGASNAGDIASKEASQETAVTLVGMVLGLALARVAAASAVVTWAAFLLLTWVHIAANVAAMRCLRLSRLNAERLAAIARHAAATGSVLTPAQAAATERLAPPEITRALATMGLGRREWTVRVAPRLESLGAGGRSAVARHFSEKEADSDEGSKDYVCVVDRQRRAVYVLLTRGAGEAETLEGFCAGVLAVEVAEGRLEGKQVQNALHLIRPEALEAAGWSCERPALGQGSARVEWDRPSKKKR